MVKALILLVLVPLLLVNKGESRSFKYNSSSADQVVQSPFLLLQNPNSSRTCKQIYGFLPCTYNTAGHLFQIVNYEILLFLGKRYVSTGSKELPGQVIFGSGAFRILEAFPEAIIVIVSGLLENKGTTQSMVMIGMGMLAGSTVMHLTLLWGSCVVVGKCDLEGSTSIDLQDTKGFSLAGSGLSTNIWTSYAARIMALSVIPFIIVQIPQLFQSSSGKNPVVPISLIICIGLLISYSIYQILHPWIQKRSLAYAKYKHVISGILRHLRDQALGSLLTDDSDPNVDILRKLFRTIDLDGDQRLSASELAALLKEIQFEDINLDHADIAKKLFADFDRSGDAYIDEDEFILGISKWLNEAMHSSTPARNSDSHTEKFIDDFHLQTKKEHDLLKGQSDVVLHSVKNTKGQFIKAVFMLLLGTVIATICAEPLVDAINNFSMATRIPSFFTSFVTLPVATNVKMSVSALTSISKKKRRNASITLSEIYGAVFMNNILGLGTILALVYVRKLTWDFSVEVLAVIFICTAMALLTSFRTTFPLWTSILAILLYPTSLLLVYLEVKGWWWFIFLPIILGVLNIFPLNPDKIIKIS